MIRKKCRVCHQALYSKPLLRYDNMPKSAQFFPDKLTLNDDKGESITVCQCAFCGLIQLENDPVSYYREVIRATGISDEMTAFREQQFSQWVEHYSLINKKIIEIGCGAGEFLNIMQTNEVTVCGVEHRLESVNKCVAQGFDVRQDFIEDETQQLAQAPFDAFYMLNFLEHLPDPNSMLKGIAHNLADGAVGLIEVPNFDMIIKKNLFSEFISDHLFYFTRETLISTINKNGFEVIKCDEIWHDYSLSVVVKKRVKKDLGHFYNYQHDLAKEIKSFISQFPDNSVAIWGAGHQALAIMSLTELAGKIKYVIDSAPFKQNKFTPATHIPIVAPDEITSNPIKAIIVMAASYSMEVTKIIRENYSSDIKIAILNENGLEVASATK